MKKLYMWTAKRAGATITITGFDANGVSQKLVGVDRIDGPTDSRPHIVAVDKDGEAVELA